MLIFDNAMQASPLRDLFCLWDSTLDYTKKKTLDYGSPNTLTDLIKLIYTCLEIYFVW